MRLTRNTCRSTAVAAALAIVLLWPSATFAQERRWNLRLQGTWTSPTGEFDLTSPEGQRITASPNQPLGLALALEYRPVLRVGFEFSGMYSRPDVDASSIYLGETIDASSEVLFLPLTGAVNLHMTPDKTVDVYAGAMFVWAIYGDLDLRAPGRGRAFLRGHDDPGWGMQAGIDLPLGQGGWSFSAAIKYLSTNYKFTDVDDDFDFEMKFNPFVLGFGVSTRF